jgi:hypothetical protein
MFPPKQTEADLANSSCGTVEDIVLNPREQIQNIGEDGNSIFWLEYPPAMVLF